MMRETKENNDKSIIYDNSENQNNIMKIQDALKDFDFKDIDEGNEEKKIEKKENDSNLIEEENLTFKEQEYRLNDDNVETDEISNDYLYNNKDEANDFLNGWDYDYKSRYYLDKKEYEDDILPDFY